MEILQHIRAEMFVIVPVLIIIGKIIKSSHLIKDKYIPLILSALSIVMSIAWIFIYTPESPPQAILDGVIQGILLAGAAVFGNQIFKQAYKKE
jgi:uncharacterized BrkB/YihY/UPF0761 family membrane protein